MAILFDDGKNDGAGTAVTLELKPSDAFAGAEMPVKLGDGNFGAVFSATGGNRNLAVKVIYKHQVPDLPPSDGKTPVNQQIIDAVNYKRSRVEDELKVRERIFFRLSNPVNPHPEYAALVVNFDQHLVLPIVYHVGFNSAADFEPFAAKYKDANIEFSEYAYAMPRFQGSLKDLMDYPAPGASNGARTGYGKLEKVVMRERERSAMPLIKDVAAGLRVLHAAGFRHQDIKPANVYYRYSAINNIEFCLGDLGFLNPEPTALAGSVLASTDALAIGTKHYRSVEQIDFSDTAEVSVTLIEGANVVELKSYDPKFVHTNIAVGDLIVFPKSASKYQYPITKFEVVDQTDGDQQPHVRLEFEVPPDGQGGAAGILPEERTQASFIKNPTARTDLFGLGGLLFDVLTAGDSPERFYELLRKFDVKNDSIQDKILNYYDNWKADQHVDPDVSAIFKRVKGPNGSTPVSLEVLTFLLKCCASECSDSFFKAYGFDQPFKDGAETPWEKIGLEITRIEEKIGAQTYGGRNVNALTRPGDVTPEIEPEPPQEPDIAHDVLSLLRNLSAADPSDAVATRDRWLRGIAFLGRAQDHLGAVSAQLETADGPRGADGTAYISLAPQHTRIEPGRSLYWKGDLAQVSWRALTQKLRSLDSLVCSLELHQSLYQPIWWPSRMRRVILSPTGDGARGGEPRADQTRKKAKPQSAQEAAKGIELNLKYSGFTLAWKGIAKGDYLILVDDKNIKTVLKIIAIQDQNVTCKSLGNRSGDAEKTLLEQWDPGVAFQGYAIKAFNSVDYMAGMYAIYMFHALFYASSMKGVTDFDNAVSARAIHFPVGDDLTLPSAFAKSQGAAGGRFFWRAKGQTKSATHRVALHSCALACWLMLGGYRQGGTDEEARNRITEEISKWWTATGAAVFKTSADLSQIDYAKNMPIPDAVTKNLKPDLTWSGVTTDTWREMVKSYLGPALKA